MNGLNLSDMQINTVYKKYFGQIYNIIAALFSWVFYFFLRNRLVVSAKVVIFSPDEIKRDMVSAVLILIALVMEMIGIGIKIRRIRHIKANPGEYGDFYIPSAQSYISDFIFFNFLALFATRLLLNIFIGDVVMSLLGFHHIWGFGALFLIIKDILFFSIGSNKLHKPIKEKIPEFINTTANLFLLFSGIIFLSIVWAAIGERFNEMLCTISNWTGMEDFIMGIILLIFFYFFFFYPTRMGYHIEELEFTDSKAEERKLLLFYLGSVVFAIIPWLI